MKPCEWSTYDGLTNRVSECPNDAKTNSKWCTKHRKLVVEDVMSKAHGNKPDIDKLRE